MIRTTRTTVTFKHHFSLGTADEVYPAGSYAIDTDQELLEEVSFPAYRRTATWMRRLDEQDPARVTPVAAVDALQLEVAILRDKGR